MKYKRMRPNSSGAGLNSDIAAFYIPLDRRRFFKSMMLATAGFTAPGAFAQALTLTPQQSQGPYYPLGDDIPLDKDNDLLYLNDNLTPASGIVTLVLFIEPASIR